MGNLATLEPPDGNLSIVPEHDENTAAGGVEGAASASREIGHTATGVVRADSLAPSAEGISEVTFGLGAVLIPVLGVCIGV